MERQGVTNVCLGPSEAKDGRWGLQGRTLRSKQTLVGPWLGCLVTMPQRVG